MNLYEEMVVVQREVTLQNNGHLCVSIYMYSAEPS